MPALAVSLFVRARYAGAAGSAQPLFTQASNISLLILMVLMVVLNFSNVVGLLGSGGLLASLILVILTTAGGYLLGRLGKAHNWVQALGADQHNIAAAMVVDNEFRQREGCDCDKPHPQPKTYPKFFW